MPYSVLEWILDRGVKEGKRTQRDGEFDTKPEAVARVAELVAAGRIASLDPSQPVPVIGLAPPLDGAE